MGWPSGPSCCSPTLTAALLLLTTRDQARTYDTLAAGGLGYLLPLTVYATVVLLSLAAYFTLPFRAGTSRWSSASAR
ncbi:hypothetical protein ACR6C2_21865 [Streptomyces sp. INA 01156]